MQSAKQDVETMLQHLPEDSTYEDIQYHLYVLEKIKRGRDDIVNGRSCSHEEAKERLSKWLNL
jgi:predicted transcriptional regulator